MTSDTLVDAKDKQQIANIIDWCKDNLSKGEWDYTIVNIIPLRIKFQFYCPKTKLLALLST